MHKTAQKWLSNNWKNLIYGAILMVALASLYLFKLGSLVRGDGFRESIQYLGINGLGNINSDITYGPVKFLQLLMVKIDEPNSTLLRLVSVASVILAVVLFYRLIRKWHTPRIALLASALFATSSFSLNQGRYSLQTAALLIVFPALLLFGTWLKSKKNVKKIIVIGPSVALLLYIPGMMIIIALLGIAFRKRLLLATQFMKRREQYTGMALTGILLVPLVGSIIQKPATLFSLSGFDFIANNALKSSFDKFLQVPIDLFYAAEIDNYRWLTGTPVLDVATIVLVILGLYGYVRGEHPLRLRLLGLGIVSSWLLITSSSYLGLGLLIPLIYILVANGIAYLLQTWFTVFPKNPAARRTGIIVVSILIAAIGSFQSYRYFIVWPNTPETKSSLISRD